jgi:hypothetical protein
MENESDLRRDLITSNSLGFAMGKPEKGRIYVKRSRQGLTPILHVKGDLR